MMQLQATISENEQYKKCESELYNFIFRKSDGLFMRWGKTQEDDPQLSLFGPEILDLEISEGKCKGRCPFCYKCNGDETQDHHMTLGEFQRIFQKMPKTLTQIAFGITDIYANPDFFAIMRYARDNGVIPNYTCHGLDVDEEAARKTAELCGAVAVSIVRKEKTYDSIKMFTDAGMKQVNIHLVYHSKNEELVYSVLDDAASDPRLKGLKAIVLLGLKQKGRGENGYEALGYEGFSKLVEYAFSKGVGIGFDSCSACKYMRWVNESSMRQEQKERMMAVAEPCESNLFSFYINCHGEGFPCSFTEGTEGWEEGISVLNCENFVKDVWNHERFQEWRKKLLGNNRNCPVYKV
jgi:MoaA/NifB/PqqE/SkfB family radical SAM enzyme